MFALRQLIRTQRGTRAMVANLFRCWRNAAECSGEAAANSEVIK